MKTEAVQDSNFLTNNVAIAIVINLSYVITNVRGLDTHCYLWCYSLSHDC